MLSLLIQIFLVIYTDFVSDESGRSVSTHDFANLESRFLYCTASQLLSRFVHIFHYESYVHKNMLNLSNDLV